ncbi:MAG: PQQ-dependent sugar dehydrogenase, partial [Solirubrobacterales bacterium]
LYGDFCVGDLRSFIPSAASAEDDKELSETVESLSSFGEDNAGHVYATSLEGPVYRLDPR